MDILKYIWSFIFGGLLCLIAQILIDKTKLTPARILVSYVVAGVILGGIGIYASFAELAGAGATVPLTGFGYNISKGVRDAIDKDGAIGILTGGMKAAAGGTTAALCFGYIAAIFAKGKGQK